MIMTTSVKVHTRRVLEISPLFDRIFDCVAAQFEHTSRTPCAPTTLPMSIRTALFAIAAHAVAASELVVTVGTQNGFFRSRPDMPAESGDIGPMK